MEKKQKQKKPKKDDFKVDLTNVEIDEKGSIVVNDPIIDEKLKTFKADTQSGQTKGPSDKLCVDTKLCLDVTCPPQHNNLCGCMPNVIGCGCPPITSPNSICIPLGGKNKKEKK